jgi:hypothetical protein
MLSNIVVGWSYCLLFVLRKVYMCTNTCTLWSSTNGVWWIKPCVKYILRQIGHLILDNIVCLLQIKLLVKKSYKCNGILSRKNMDIQNSIGFLEKVKRFIEYDKNDTNYTSTTKKCRRSSSLSFGLGWSRVTVEGGGGSHQTRWRRVAQGQCGLPPAGLVLWFGVWGFRLSGLGLQ